MPPTVTPPVAIENSQVPGVTPWTSFKNGTNHSISPWRTKPVQNSAAVKVILTLTAAEFCTGFVRQGLMLWFVPFLKEVHGVTPGTWLFSIATGGVTVGGIVGGLLCGWMSDKLFQSRRAPVAFVFYLAQIVALFLLGRTHEPAAACFLIG